MPYTVAPDADDTARSTVIRVERLLGTWSDSVQRFVARACVERAKDPRARTMFSNPMHTCFSQTSTVINRYHVP
jgi:hypothetical protein